MATTITFDGPDFGALVLDACLSQQHGKSADITRHRVEQGVDITDHIRPGPLTLTVNGLIAYAPPRSLAELVIGTVFDKNRHVKAFERLLDAIDRSELVTVDTGLKLYKNMAIRTLDSPRETRTGFDFVFTLQLEEVRFVEAATVTVPPIALGKAAPGASKPAAKSQVQKTQRQATPTQQRGAAPKQTPTPAQDSRGSSLLFKLKRFL